MKIVETERLVLRRMTMRDAGFMHELLNQPSFIRFIGDRGVRTRADARRYIQNGPMVSYFRFGFGLYVVALKESGGPIGICGLLKRDSLQNVDIGFAFLPAFWSQGYAYESARAVMQFERHAHDLKRILAITSPDNDASIKLLHRLGFRYEGMVKLREDEAEVRLFVSDVS